jgi:hypothetical protein
MLVAHRSHSNSYTTDPTAASLKTSLRHVGSRPAAPVAGSGHSREGLASGDLQALYPSLYRVTESRAQWAIPTAFLVRPLAKAAILMTPILCGLVYHILQ